MADQGQGQLVRDEVAAPEAGAREHVEEGPDDDGELLGRELVEGQPLAEDALGGQGAANRLEMLCV